MQLKPNTLITACKTSSHLKSPQCSMSNKFTEDDFRWMKQAIELADRGRGYVAPNPLVGCIIVSSEGNVVGEGFHERYGQAHAEINAINSVRDKSELIDATMYVTLEPCSHTGKTPSCAKEILDLPLKRIVIGMQDPNPLVNGEGVAILKKSNRFKVETGCMEREVRRQNEAFVHYMRFQKPFVTLKIAQTVDGYVAAPDGNSKWISCEESRKKVHEWRSYYDAVMVGRNTAQIDNPNLTVRHVEGRQPRRIVIDGDLSLPANLNVFTDQHEQKTIVLTHNKEKYEQTADPMLQLLKSDYFRGETVLVSKKEGHTDLNHAMELLGEMQITSILVEAGSQLASAMIKDNVVDKLHVFIVPKLLGGGTRSLLGVGRDRMEDILDLHDANWEQVGSDMLLTGYF